MADVVVTVTDTNGTSTHVVPVPFAGPSVTAAAKATGSKVRVTWSAVGGVPTGWRVTRDGPDVPAPLNLPASAHIATFDRLRPATAYTFTVVGVFPQGERVDTVTVTTP